MMLEAGLAGARFFHLACAIILFGGTSFVLYSRLDVSRSKRLTPLPAILATAALGALLSGLGLQQLCVGLDDRDRRTQLMDDQAEDAIPIR